MTKVEKRASVEILEMLIEHELSLGYENADADFISECVGLCLAIQETKINPEDVKKRKNKLLKLMGEKFKEVRNGSNKNTQDT
ncbi:MAG: hypothetical protein II306_03740 [Clostridia bacterium]|nr:hypothetical protein [Clostridia bacterium]